MNITALIELILALGAQIREAAMLIKQARAENRDILDEELAVLVAKNDVARAELVAAIERAKARCAAPPTQGINPETQETSDGPD
jgi:hypothetical protein